VKDIVGKIQQEAASQGPIRRIRFTDLPIPTCTPSEVRDNTPAVGPLQCHACTRKFFCISYLGSLAKLAHHRGNCPFEDCNAVFVIQPATPAPKRKIPIIQKARL
jgi:hypothetical protein